MNSSRALLLGSLLLTASCTTTSPSAAAPATARATPVTLAAAIAPGKVDGAEAKALADAGAKLLDVRSEGEFAANHLDRSVNIPFDQVEKRLSDVGAPDAPVVVYCEAGGRAAKAVETLHAHGYTKVYDLGSIHSYPK